MKPDYDVVIMGGGLAGLTLSLQLKQERPETQILILEKRGESAPTAAHKVGESTVELGTYYLREVLDLKGYLDEKQLPKHGLRFFFSPRHKDTIEKRVELGPRERLPVPSHQLDRGTLENELIHRSRKSGNEIILGAKVEDVTLSPDTLHEVRFSTDTNKDQTVSAKWVVDATSRHALLKRKLGFAKEIDHNVNAVWFRVDREIDVTDWSSDEKWQSFLEPGLRRLGTIHLMDKGYWVWLIPLSSSATSVGIVADGDLHPFTEINRLERAMSWMEKHEPLAHQMISPLLDHVLDFKVLKHYAHNSGRIYSAEKWAVTGESGAFLDPFYSPGTDFISMNNTWLTDLIIRDMNGESIELHASVYEKTHLALFDSWIPVYQNKYQLMGSTQIMVIKIFWDWAIYWGIPCLLFTNKGYTNLSVLKRLFSNDESAGRRFGALNNQMQKVFLEWLPYDTGDFTERYIDPFDIQFLREFHKGIEEQFSPRELITKIEENLEKLEKIAAEIFRLISNQVHGTPMDISVDPYTMQLFPEENQSLKTSIAPDKEMNEQVRVMWFYPVKETVS